MIKFNLINKNKGFTMVETLVAVAVLMISIAGPLTIAQKGLTAAIYARDQVIASFLAQDAMEYIKNYRDYNVMIGNSWNTGLSGCALDKCMIETITAPGAPLNAPVSCAGVCTDLLYKKSNGYTRISTGAEETQFKRNFYITNVTPTEATVVVNVSWSNGTVQNVVSLEDQLFNIVR